MSGKQFVGIRRHSGQRSPPLFPNSFAQQCTSQPQIAIDVQPRDQQRDHVNLSALDQRADQHEKHHHGNLVQRFSHTAKLDHLLQARLAVLEQAASDRKRPASFLKSGSFITCQSLCKRQHPEHARLRLVSGAVCRERAKRNPPNRVTNCLQILSVPRLAAVFRQSDLMIFSFATD